MQHQWQNNWNLVGAGRALVKSQNYSEFIASIRVAMVGSKAAAPETDSYFVNFRPSHLGTSKSQSPEKQAILYVRHQQAVPGRVEFRGLALASAGFMSESSVQVLSKQLPSFLGQVYRRSRMQSLSGGTEA